MNCIDKNCNLRPIASPRPSRRRFGLIQKFFARPPFVLYLPALISFSSSANPSLPWVIHCGVPMSAGVVPEKRGITTTWRHTHTHRSRQPIYINIYPLSNFSLTMWANRGMCQGTSVLTVEKLLRRGGIFSVALGQGNFPSSSYMVVSKGNDVVWILAFLVAFTHVCWKVWQLVWKKWRDYRERWITSVRGGGEKRKQQSVGKWW